VHPTDQTLQSYGLGKLDDAAAESVHEHLEGCPDCRRRAAEISPDSFLGRLREAKARPESLRPAVSSTDGLSVLGAAPGAAAPPPASTLPPGLADHPDYEIVRELGRGGMGVVYLARNTLMGRSEVLKVVGGHLVSRPAIIERFLREIRSAARLHHPNIVTAYTALRFGESLALAMEYVEGLDLARIVKAKGPLPVANACNYVHQAALGLQHAHEHGMVHRDIKPANLILARASGKGSKAMVKVLDFGLAKVTSEGQADSGLTREGQMLGTPDYIAPEQIRDAQSADIRADIYSLGCTLYYLLLGRTPFTGDKLWDVYQAHFSMDASPLNLVRPEVPVELAALVAKMMAKEPDRRFQEPKDVARALAPFFKAGQVTSARSGSDVSRAESVDARPKAAGAPLPPTSGLTPVVPPGGHAPAARRPGSPLEGLIDLRDEDPLRDTLMDSPGPEAAPDPTRQGAPARSGMWAKRDGLGTRKRWAAAGVLLCALLVACPGPQAQDQGRRDRPGGRARERGGLRRRRESHSDLDAGRPSRVDHGRRRPTWRRGEEGRDPYPRRGGDRRDRRQDGDPGPARKPRRLSPVDEPAGIDRGQAGRIGASPDIGRAIGSPAECRRRSQGHGPLGGLEDRRRRVGPK
jgi:serine/threonine protein kinase